MRIYIGYLWYWIKNIIELLENIVLTSSKFNQWKCSSNYQKAQNLTGKSSFKK